MVAPVRSDDPTTEETRQRMRIARRAIASALLGPKSEVRHGAPQIVAWKAWLFAGWTTFIAILFIFRILGFF